MPLATVPTEITLLGWAVVLLVVQLFLQATAAALEFGPPYAFSPRDEGREVKGLYAGRIRRAFYNFLETFPAFVALALGLAVTGRTGGLGLHGAEIWFFARIVFWPVYVLGIPYLRTAVWAVSVVGLVLMLIPLL